jgi:hypothetical protein
MLVLCPQPVGLNACARGGIGLDHIDYIGWIIGGVSMDPGARLIADRQAIELGF